MANTGAPNSNGSQFFITFGPQPGLNGGYTIFGHVTSGMEVVQAITLRDPQKDPTTPGDKITPLPSTSNNRRGADVTAGRSVDNAALPRGRQLDWPPPYGSDWPGSSLFFPLRPEDDP